MRKAITVELDVEISEGFPFFHDEVAEVDDPRTDIGRISSSLAQRHVFYLFPKEGKGGGFASLNVMPAIQEAIAAYPELVGAGVSVCTATLHQIYAEFTAERERQDEQWGGAEHDDGHDALAWLGFIHDQGTRAGNEYAECRERDIDPAIRARLVKIAALAVAGMQSIDRKAAAGGGP